MATESTVSEYHDLDGSLIGIVLASLVERVTALEQQRPANTRPIINDEASDYYAVSREGIRNEVRRLYAKDPNLTRLAERLGYSVKTIRTWVHGGKSKCESK